MNFATFIHSEVIHALDGNFTPLCLQTDAGKHRRLQQVIASAPTCQRCITVLELFDKNSAAARTRRRYLAACQALRDGRAGVFHFEKRTTDQPARQKMANVIAAEILALTKIHSLLTPPQAPRAQKVK